MFNYGYPSSSRSSASLSDPFGYDFERAQQLREQQARQAQLRKLRAQKELAELEARREERLAYERALREERAHRLSDALRAQRDGPSYVRPIDDPDEPRVDVQLADGRWCLVPESWVERLRAKYGEPELWRDPSPSPPEVHDDVLAHDGTFYPHRGVDHHLRYPPSPAPSPSPSHASAARPATPVAAPRFAAAAARKPQPSEAERDRAARMIQGVVRRRLRLRQLEPIASALQELRRCHRPLPAPSSLVFPAGARPAEGGGAPNLAYNTPANRPVQEYEQALLKLLTQLDAIDSAGFEEVKRRRKEVVKEVEKELEDLDRLKAKAWEDTCQRHDGGGRRTGRREGEYDELDTNWECVDPEDSR